MARTTSPSCASSAIRWRWATPNPPRAPPPAITWATSTAADCWKPWRWRARSESVLARANHPRLPVEHRPESRRAAILDLELDRGRHLHIHDLAVLQERREEAVRRLGG